MLLMMIMPANIICATVSRIENGGGLACNKQENMTCVSILLSSEAYVTRNLKRLLISRVQISFSRAEYTQVITMVCIRGWFNIQRLEYI